MPKVKLFAAIPRKKDISAQEFHDHWRHPHGTLARRISTIRRYAQSHHIPCDELESGPPRFEGVAEVWMDNVEDALALASEPVYVADIAPDEPLFIDLPNLKFLITEEDVVFSGPDRRQTEHPVGDAHWYDDDRAVNIKVLQFIETRDRTSWVSDTDRELGIAIGALRHVRCYPSSAVYAQDEPAFFGVRELWWPTITAFSRGVESNREAWNKLLGTHPLTILSHSERFK